jgi:hypothetical protein
MTDWALKAECELAGDLTTSEAKILSLLQKTYVMWKSPLGVPNTLHQDGLLKQLRGMKHAFDAIKVTETGERLSLLWQSRLY